MRAYEYALARGLKRIPYESTPPVCHRSSDFHEVTPKYTSCLSSQIIERPNSPVNTPTEWERELSSNRIVVLRGNSTVLRVRVKGGPRPAARGPGKRRPAAQRPE